MTNPLGSSVVGLDGWVVPGTRDFSAPTGTAPAKPVFAEAMIVTRKRNVPCKGKSKVQESLTLLYSDFLYMGLDRESFLG